MIDPFKTDSDQSKLVLRRFAATRAAIVLVVAVLCSALYARNREALDLTGAYLYSILFVALVESLIVSAILSTSYNPTIRFSFMLLTADLVLISAIVVLTGGSTSAFAFLYIAAILSATILLSFQWSLLITTICSLLFLSVVLLEHNGIVVPAFIFRRLQPAMDAGDLWAYTGMKVLAFYLTAFLSGYLSHRIGMLQSFQHNILNNFSSGFISVNGDCKVTFFNSAASSLLRRPWVECIGQDASIVFPVDEGRANPLEEAVAEGKECQSREIIVRRGDGERIPVGVTVSPLRNGAGGNRGAVASFVDLTELKRMEEMLRRSDKLAAIGEMSASLAHEIRNPVASIRGAVQELADNARLEGTNQQLMKIAIRESDQLSGIITGFLEFVDPGPTGTERFNISQMLKEAVQTARQRYITNGDIHIVGQFPDKLGVTVGDRARVKEAVLGLIHNGVEATQGAGAVSVTAELCDDPPDGVSISIRDEGIGIPEEEIGKVFDLFHSTKPHGIGLGMAIVHKIITSHGGSIDIESVWGKGTTVTIGLPRGD